MRLTGLAMTPVMIRSLWQGQKMFNRSRAIWFRAKCLTHLSHLKRRSRPPQLNKFVQLSLVKPRAEPALPR